MKIRFLWMVTLCLAFVVALYGKILQEHLSDFLQ